MTHAEFKARIAELESLGYAIKNRNDHNCTATAKKGRRVLSVGEKK